MSNEGNRAAEATTSLEQELRLLVETIPAPVWRAGPEGNVEFAAQLQATLNVIPAYTWYAAPSGGLTFVNNRTADYLGVPKDHPLRSGIDIGARWDDWVPLLHPDDHEESRKAQTVCARARPVSTVFDFVALKETTAGSSPASNRSGQLMEPYCCGLGRL